LLIRDVIADDPTTRTILGEVNQAASTNVRAVNYRDVVGAAVTVVMDRHIYSSRKSVFVIAPRVAEL